MPAALSVHTRLLHALSPLSAAARMAALEFWSERVAIREHLGEAKREAAEEDAARETCAEYGVPWKETA